MSFPRNKTDIVQRIGAKHHVFGINLLNDEDGSKTSGFEDRFGRDAYRICLEIFKLWLQGQGRKPVTWVTLVTVLKDIDLLTLASEIETSLTQSV